MIEGFKVSEGLCVILMGSVEIREKRGKALLAGQFIVNDGRLVQTFFILTLFLKKEHLDPQRKDSGAYLVWSVCETRRNRSQFSEPRLYTTFPLI